MSGVKLNIAANLGGSAWAALMSFLFIPFYIRFLGIEAYGLVGVFVILQTVLTLFDLGSSTALNRELARLSVHEQNALEMRDAVRTIEIPYWALAIFAGVILHLTTPFLSSHWLKLNRLPEDSALQALRMMSLAVALQLPSSLYAGGLMGLQLQFHYNAILAFISTFRNAGAVLVLWLLSPTIQAFFIWQCIAALLQTSLMGTFLWRSLPKATSRSRFRFHLLARLWRFSAGVGGISIFAVILTQLDKIVLSRLLPLDLFGYYILASTVASSLSRVAGPIFFAIYPRFTQLVAMGNLEELRLIYHKASQLMSVLILPLAIIVAFFSRQILLLWTQNTQIAESASLLLSLLIAGSSLNALMHVPYALQLAFGWTSLALYTNFVAVLVLGPMIYVMASLYGPVGAATVWVFLNTCYILISLQIMHHRLLPDQKWRWYKDDAGKPLIIVLSITILGKLFSHYIFSDSFMLLYLILVYTAALLSSIFFTPAVRDHLLIRLLRRYTMTYESRGRRSRI
jgi:O-antigen/teichoic acid export membrane protein